MVFNRKKKNQHGLAALATATIKLARAQVVLNETEAALERELQKEAKSVPKTKIQKIRKKGEHLIHSKHVLLLIVFLNIIDCLLVLGELMLDIKYVTDLLHKEHNKADAFIGSMRGLYPEHLDYLLPGDIEILREEILKAHLSWDNTHSSGSSHNSHQDTDGTHIPSDNTQISGADTTTQVADNSTNHSGKRRRSAVSDSSMTHAVNGNHSDTGHEEEHHAEHAHSVEEDIAHALHKASITILGILVAETFCKVFFLGRDMLDHKLEFNRYFSETSYILRERIDNASVAFLKSCFDGVIVLASFIVDLVLLKGLQQFAVQDFVLILAFLVPWRIIRVVNSLVVAIMDHEHFRLKLLYKQKKKVSAELKTAKSELKGLEACISALETMCKEAGIPETNIKAKLVLYRKTQNKTSAMSALAGFALGGEAMKKPMEMEPIKTDHVVQVVTESTEMTTSENPVSPPSGSIVDELAKQTVITAYDIIEPWDNNLRIKDLRTRSYSAIEPGEGKDRWLSPNFVRKLAESSARFIATMHQDNANGRYNSSLQLRSNTEKGNTNRTTHECDDNNCNSDKVEQKQSTTVEIPDSGDKINSNANDSVKADNTNKTLNAKSDNDDTSDNVKFF